MYSIMLVSLCSRQLHFDSSVEIIYIVHIVYNYEQYTCIYMYIVYIMCFGQCCKWEIEEINNHYIIKHVYSYLEEIGKMQKFVMDN